LGNNMTVCVDDELLYEGKSLLAVAANGRVYGGGFLAAPQAEIQDGLIDCLAVKNMSRLKITGFVGKYKVGNHQPLSHLITKARGKRMTICSDRPFAISYDGEVEMTTKAEIELLPHALKVVVPFSTRKD
ncbi:MAG: diacylglycerol kinase family lipid kinase, partial [Clostridia bacterium]|nr:diacylglycerol kinase family lipid kinase [Clostridia bacterium]